MLDVRAKILSMASGCVLGGLLWLLWHSASSSRYGAVSPFIGMATAVASHFTWPAMETKDIGLTLTGTPPRWFNWLAYGLRVLFYAGVTYGCAVGANWFFSYSPYFEA